MPENSSSSAAQAENIHYMNSPETIQGRVHCIRGRQKLSDMNIDQRWENDNRIPTWNFGMANFGFDQNFIHKGNIINDGDEFVQNICSDVEEEDGITRKITGTRKVNYNGNWFVID